MKFFIKKLFSVFLLVYAALVGIGIAFSDQLIFLPQAPSYGLSQQYITVNSVDASDKTNTNKIIVKHIKNPASKYTILYSHGNAVDLGGLQHLQSNFYKHGYSIVIYDYSGYGHSEELYEAANSPKKFLAFETEGHSGITHSAAFWPALNTFISTM